MEAWLKSNVDSFKFPFVPQTLPVNKSFNVHTENLANGNEVSFYGGENLKRTTISAHFPADSDRTYLDDSSVSSPQECVQKIEQIAKSDGEIRYIVTETEINIPVKILSFDRQIQDATGDIHFTLSMVEYNPPKPKAWTPPPPLPKPVETNKKVVENKKVQNKSNQTKSVKKVASTNANNKRKVQLKGRTNNRVVPKYYTTKKKQNIYDIAHKTTGKPKTYKNIMTLNTSLYKNVPTVFKDIYTIKIPPKNYKPKQNSYKKFYNQITSKKHVNPGPAMAKWMKGL